MKPKFTFKTEKPTGRLAWVNNPCHYIKLNKVVVVGLIEEGTWKIRLKVVKEDINEDGNSNCPWKWILLKFTTDSLENTKICLNENCEKIVNSYNLYISEL